ncbi:MAG: hypothetical protein J6K14_08420 [Clostridia bacterium]|nr:hypothetical protein [Clostridia bacterium]
MNKEKFSPYATNKGGRIEAPRKVSEGEPRATKTVGDDLRIKRNAKGKKG